MSVDIQLTSNAAEIARQLRDLPQAMASAIAAAMDKENMATVGYISEQKLSRRGAQTLGVVTGRLRGSLRATRSQASSSGVESAIGTNVEYAGAHEFGSRPHRIAARNAKMLRFSGRGGIVFRKFVNHPGTPARAPIGTGISERAENYTRSLSQAIEEAWEK